MLLCDKCDSGWHMGCLSPQLTDIPEDSWFCPSCLEFHVDQIHDHGYNERLGLVFLVSWSETETTWEPVTSFRDKHEDGTFTFTDALLQYVTRCPELVEELEN